MAERTDHDLIYASQNNDRAAFAMLVERHYRFMFKVAWKWCGNRDDAEDIAQEAAVKLARGIHAFRFESEFTTWLHSLVVNAGKDYFKAKNRTTAREKPLFDDVEFASRDLSPEEQAESKDVLKAIATLPEDMRETVVLVCWQGLSHREAGDILGCAEGTVSWRISEARKKIAATLEEGNKVKAHG